MSNGVQQASDGYQYPDGRRWCSNCRSTHNKGYMCAWYSNHIKQEVTLEKLRACESPFIGGEDTEGIDF